jgi:hypothetical membrane protein
VDGALQHAAQFHQRLGRLFRFVSPLVDERIVCAAGLLIFFGAVLLHRLLPRIAVILLAIAGLGVLVVGLVPEDTNARLHLQGAAAHFLGGNIAILLLAKRWRSWITFAAGSIGLLATLALAFRGMGPDIGTVERLAAYPLPLILSWSGWKMLRE